MLAMDGEFRLAVNAVLQRIADRRLARERAAKGLPSVGREACLRRLQRQRARLFWEAAEAALAA
jgi:hypothetical protein